MRVKSPCYLGSRHRHPSSVPARHHQFDYCSPRGNGGCGSTHLAFASEEKALSDFRTPCTHRHVHRTPCVADHSPASSSRTECGMFLASLSPFPVLHQYTLLFTMSNGSIGQQSFEAYAAYICNITTSFSIPTFDPLRETSKGTSSEQTRML
jgi:hypothetical protein